MSRPERTDRAVTGQQARPHDLLWLNTLNALIGPSGPLPGWVGNEWCPALPVVVRRDFSAKGWIPVGIRGSRRHERLAAWTLPEHIRRLITPESLVEKTKLRHSPFFSNGPVSALLQLASLDWPWTWGVTGSCAYALATGCPVMHGNSDLDLLIRCPQPVKGEQFAFLIGKLDSLPCRVDVQIETPAGAFALAEWLRRGEKGGRVLLKTNAGPVLTFDPWQKEEKKA